LIGLLEDPGVEVAPRLLGMELQRGPVRVRITEVEAYGGPEDSASHARFGRTRRNGPMWGPPGRAYIYLCYGIHRMLNVTVGPEGCAGAVLIRAGEVVEGLEDVRARRRTASQADRLLAGPGRLGQGLGLQVSETGGSLLGEEMGGSWQVALGPVRLVEGKPPIGVRVGTRVGIDFARPEDREKRWRFAVEGTRAVTHARNLCST
jgi:DNA-3-methyladenine glycosylase